MINIDKRLKIIFLINELGKGGSERQLYLLLKFMDLDEAEPLVVVFNPSVLTDYADSIRSLGVRVIPLPPAKHPPLKRVVWLFHLLREEKPTVVHSWSAIDNPYASIVGSLSGVPLRMGSLRNSLRNRSFSALPLPVQILAIYSCPYILVNDDSIQKELQVGHYPQGRIFQLKNCVEIPQSRIKADLPPIFSESHRVVGIVSNLRNNKNIDIFIEGLATLFPRFPDLRGVIVGQPIPDELDYYQYIQKLIQEKNLADMLILLGFRDDAPLLVQEFEVFCQLSDFEGSPNAVLEAMAAGRPVIASDTSGIPHLVQDGVTGYLIPPGDSSAFATAMEKILNDPNLEEMGAEGRKRVESHFSCHEAATGLLDLYQQLLEKKK